MADREAERQATLERLDHCLTCGSHTADVPHHLHRDADKPLHRYAQAQEQRQQAQRDLTYWNTKIAEMEADRGFMEQVKAAVTRLTPFGRTVAAQRGIATEQSETIAPLRAGQLVRVRGHMPLGEIGRVRHQRGTSADCGLPAPVEPVYEVYLIGKEQTQAYFHHELETVQICASAPTC